MENVHSYHGRLVGQVLGDNCLSAWQVVAGSFGSIAQAGRIPERALRAGFGVGQSEIALIDTVPLTSLRECGCGGNPRGVG